jgi:hemoglobin
MTPTPDTPSLEEWAGGSSTLRRLTTRFYDKVAADPLLAPVFSGMAPLHAVHVASFLTEVLGGDPMYTSEGGSHARMIRRHMGRHLTEAQRRRWMTLMLDTADEVGLPVDPEFRASFTGYLEWGTRIAVLNSAEGLPDPDPAEPMPLWTWSSPGGPAER